MLSVKLCFILSFLWGCALGARKVGLVDCTLCDYVYFDDGHFTFSLVETAEIEAGVTSYRLNMTSLKWNDEKFTLQPIWYHTVIINVPIVTSKRPHNTCFMVFTGERNIIPITLTGNRKTIKETAKMAAETQSITAIGYNIPNEEIVFVTPAGNLSLDSDEAMAYTQAIFEKFPFAPTTIITPMVKAALKTMDTVEQFLAEKNVVNEKLKFVVQGASKRAYAAWLTAALDDRVIATVPTTGTMLKFQDFLVRTYQNLNGSWPFYFGPWQATKAIAVTHTPNARIFVNTIDPIAYKDFLNMPKLIIAAASDGFMAMDTSNLWFRDLPGEKKFWFLENSGHFINLFPIYTQFWSGVKAFYRTILQDETRPNIVWWKRITRKGKGKIIVRTDMKPTHVSAFMANSVVSYRRDFRRFIICPNCKPFKICSTCIPIPLKDTGEIWQEDATVVKTRRTKNGKYKYTVKYRTPSTGYHAFYIRMKFAGGLIFSTDALVMPDTLPVNNYCNGLECLTKPLV